MSIWKPQEIRDRLTSSLGEVNEFGVQLKAILDVSKLKVSVICPLCGNSYEVSGRQWKHSKCCAECRYEKQFGHKKKKTTRRHHRDEADLTDAELEATLNPKTLWERMRNRDKKDRYIELDEIAYERRDRL